MKICVWMILFKYHFFSLLCFFLFVFITFHYIVIIAILPHISFFINSKFSRKEMVLAELGKGLTTALAKLQNTTVIDDEVINDMIKEICNALLHVYIYDYINSISQM